MTMAEREPVIFELIDLPSGNVVNSFANVCDALASIRRLARTHGWGSARNLALLRLEGCRPSIGCHGGGFDGSRCIPGIDGDLTLIPARLTRSRNMRVDQHRALR